MFSEVYCNLRDRGNITNTALFLSLEDFMAPPWGIVVFGIFVDLGTVIAKELSEAFPNTNGYLKELTGYSFCMWQSSHYYTPLESTTLEVLRIIGYKLWLIVKAIIAFIIISTATTFVFRIGLTASAIVLVMASNSLYKK